MRLRLVTGVLWLCWISAVNAEPMTVEDVLQRVVTHYPSLRATRLEVEKARQDSVKVQSQLGWQLGVQGGYDRNVSFFGTGVDRLDVNAGVNRSLASGGDIALSAQVAREESDESIIPSIANPSTTTNLNINYRKPLRKGSGNPNYHLGLENAEIGERVATAERMSAYDQIASETIEIYLAAMTTRSRIENTKQSIERTQRLRQYIKGRMNLGIAEDKDLLQVIAQNDRQQAQLKSLELAWLQQKVNLNRLMGNAWDFDLELSLPKTLAIPDISTDSLFDEVKQYSPALQQINSRIQIATNQIESQRDAGKDALDLVLYAGNYAIQGDRLTDDGDTSEIVGGVRVEYGKSMDHRGFDASLYQAQLDRGIALENRAQIEQDLLYELTSLIAELQIVEDALRAYKRSVKSEQAKLEEATSRYKKGRLQVDVLIQFEGELAAAELSLELHKVEVERRLQRLAILRGAVWQQVMLPQAEQAIHSNKEPSNP